MVAAQLIPYTYPQPPMAAHMPVKEESPPLSDISFSPYAHSHKPAYNPPPQFRFGQHPQPHYSLPPFSFMTQSRPSSASPIYASASLSSGHHFTLPPLSDSGILSMPEDYEDGDDLHDLPSASFENTAGPSGSSSSSQAMERVIRRRSSKACDQCRKSKCKCERSSENEPCKSCILLGTPCTFLGPSRKRGPPKGYIDAIEARLHQTEALIGIMLAADDARAKGLLDDLSQDPLAREIIQRVDGSSYGVKGRKSKVAGKPRSQTDGNTKTPPESEALTSTHPSNEWQDRVSSRLSSIARSRGHALPDPTHASPRHLPMSSSSSRPALSLSISRPDSSADGEERRLRRRTSLSPPGSPRSASRHSSEPGDVLDEHDREIDDDGLVSEVGQLSLNEEREVRYHGKASGLHLLGVKDRVDGRNEGGIWRFPKARIWPPLPREHSSQRPEEPDLASLPMPDRAAQEHLLDLYFTYVHPALPIVHKKTFLQDFRNGNVAASSPQSNDAESPGGSSPLSRRRPYIPAMLLMAMFAVAARYTTTDNASVPPSESAMWPAGDAYLEAAKNLMSTPDTPSRPTTVQTLLILGYREIGIGAMSQAWLYVGVAVRMAQDLGIHKCADRWMHSGTSMFSRVELQERRRIWYACIVMDKYVSAYIGRPLLIYERDFDTEMPSIDEPEERDDWLPLSQDENKQHPAVPMPGRIMSCFNASASLSIILSKVIQAIYAVRSGPGRHVESLRLEVELDKWYLDLPEHLRFDPSGGSKTGRTLPFVLTLHMQYWCVVLLLHRPFMRYALEVRTKGINGDDDPELHAISKKNYDLCVQAANHMTSIVVTYSGQYSITRVPVFLSYYVFTASIMHVTTLNAYPEDPQARKGLTTCMDILQEMSMVWPSAGRAWELLHGSKVNLSSATRAGTAPIVSEERLHKRSADHFLHDNDPSFFAAHAAPHRYAPSPSTAEPYYTQYDRWPSEGGLSAFAGSLSTSVLPQQYSTGFVDRSGAGQANGVPPHASGHGRSYPAYWSDVGTLNQLSAPFGGALAQDPALQAQQQPQMYHAMSEQYQIYGDMNPPHS